MSLQRHSLTKVKAVRIDSAEARNKPDLLTVIFSCVLDKPVKQLSAVAFRIVHCFSRRGLRFQVFTARKPFGDSDPATALIS